MSVGEGATSFETRCEILSDLWTKYRDQGDLEDFISYNDLGLPLAFAVDEELVKANKVGEILINETFDLLMQALGIDDSGFDSIEDILGAV